MAAGQAELPVPDPACAAGLGLLTQPGLLLLLHAQLGWQLPGEVGGMAAAGGMVAPGGMAAPGGISALR